MAEEQADSVRGRTYNTKHGNTRHEINSFDFVFTGLTPSVIWPGREPGSFSVALTEGILYLILLDR